MKSLQGSPEDTGWVGEGGPMGIHRGDGQCPASLPPSTVSLTHNCQ